VRLLELVPRCEGIALPLQWEAAGAAGRLFPVLDADLTLVPAGASQTLIRLDGAYRPPLGAVGATLDRMVLHRAATATIRSLLSRIAAALARASAACHRAGDARLTGAGSGRPCLRSPG
jgi:hypothetical protein